MANTFDRVKKVAEAGIPSEWHTEEDVCPKCGKATQFKSVEENGHVYVVAERCVPCGWEFEF